MIKSHSPALPGKWKRAKLGYLPFSLGSLSHLIKDIPTSTTKVPSNRGFRKAYRKAKTEFNKHLGEKWLKLGKEKAYGTHITDPSSLQGNLIAAMISSPKTREIETVTGRVLDAQIAYDESGKKFFEITLLTNDGVRTFSMPGLRNIHAYTFPKQNWMLSMLEKTKFMIEKQILSLARYATEVEAVKLRVLLKPRDLEKESLYPKGGFMRKVSTEHGPIYFIFHPVEGLFRVGDLIIKNQKTKKGKKVEDTDFLVPSVVGGLQHHLIRKPISVVLEKLFGIGERLNLPRTEAFKAFSKKPLELSAPVTMVLEMLAFLAAYGWFNDKWDESLIDRRHELIHENRDQFLDMIESDPLLAPIKEKKDRNPFADNEALDEYAEEAFLRLEALETFYFYMNELYDPETPSESIEELLKDEHAQILFPAIRSLREKGPIAEPGIEVTRTQPISSAEVTRLMQLKYDLLQKRPLFGMLNQPNELAKTLEHEDATGMTHLKPILGQLIQDPYYQALLALEGAGEIDPTQFERLATETAQWEEKFQRWNLVGAKRIHEGKPLTLAEIERLQIQSLFEGPEKLTQLYRPDVFPHGEFDHGHLLERKGGDLSKLHVIRHTSPYWGQLGFIQNIFQTQARGEYKRATRRHSVAASQVMAMDGSVAERITKPGMFSQVLGVTGKAIIGYDIYAHMKQRSDMEEEVISSPEIKPYQGSTLPDTPSPLVGKVQEIRESLPKDPDERLLFLRNHPNPYLRLYADQKEK